MPTWGEILAELNHDLTPNGIPDFHAAYMFYGDPDASQKATATMP